MKADSLLRLYPRTWRERYGDEFADLLGDQPLKFKQVLDVVAGAIDARLTPQPHMAAARGPNVGGESVMNALRASCGVRSVPYTRKEALISAAAMIGLTIVFSFGGIALKRNGWEELGEFMLGFGFPASLVISVQPMYMKGQSTKAKVILIGGPLVILGVLSYLAAFI
jgi:hypothetical protein